MEIYSNPFDWGCHWVCNKLDCGKDVIPSKKRDSCIWEETSLYTRSYPKRTGTIGKSSWKCCGQLLTPEYLGEKLLSKESEEEFKSHVQSWIDSQKASEDTLYSSISNIVEEDRLNNFIVSTEESLSDFLSEKIIAMEPGKLIVDKVMQEAQNKLSESMFGMMLGGSFLEKIAGQVQDGIDTYIQENAREYVGKAVVKESKELQEKPMPEVTAFLEEKGIYDPEFLWGLYKKVIEDKLPALLSSLKLSLVVEERINAMQVEEVEELVLSIMNKELGAIVNLGAVIGLILGLINVIIFII